MGILDVFDEGKQVKDTQKDLKTFIVGLAKNTPELVHYADKIEKKVQSMSPEQALMFLDGLVKNTPTLKPYYKKIISRFAGSDAVVQSNIDPATAVVAGATGGIGGGLSGMTKGAVASLASEPVFGEAFTAYENTVRKKLPDWLKFPADIALNFLVGHFVSKLGKAGEEVARKVKVKLENKPEITIDDIEKAVKELPEEHAKVANEAKEALIAKGLQVAKTATNRKLNTEQIANGIQALDNIRKEEWQRFVKHITEQVRSKQPIKNFEEVDDLSDIKPKPTPVNKIKEQVKQALSHSSQSAIAPNSIKNGDLELNLVDEQIRHRKLARWVDYKGKYKNANVELSVRKTPEGTTYYISLSGETYPIKDELKKAGFYYSSGEWTYEGDKLPKIFSLPEIENLKSPDKLTKDELKEIFKGKKSDELIDKLYGRIQKRKSELGLYSGIDPLKAFDALHDAIKKIDEKLSQTAPFKAIPRLARKIGLDKYGLPFIPEEKADNLILSLYSKARPKFASEVQQSKDVVSWLKDKLGNKVSHGFVIEYLESPEFRTKVKTLSAKNKDLEDIAKNLDGVIEQIERLSKELYDRGYLSKAQYKKWKGRYLSRIYQAEDAIGIDTLGGLKQAQIKSGRKIESIMALPKEKRQKLGYVEDAPLAIMDTIAKSSKTLALDDWFRDVVKYPELVKREFLVKIPEDIRKIKPQLPEEASPYFVKNLVKKLIQDGIPTNRLRGLAQEANQKIKLIEANKKQLEKEGFVSIGEKQKLRFGILSGLPVRKEFAGWLKGLTSITDDPHGAISALDKAMTAWITAFKTAKVPLNIQAIPRNWLSNLFQWYLSGANRPISYFGRALKEVINKGQYYRLAEKQGLFHTNFTDEEIAGAIRKLKNTSRSKIYKAFAKLYESKPAESLIKLYSSIDDVWKLARFMYAIERERLPIDKAIKTAQDSHFDYSLVGTYIRAMRDPNIEHGTALKLIAPLFPTYMHKSLSLLVDSISKRPIQTFLTLSAPLLLIHTAKKKMEERFGKDKVEDAYRYMPDWLPKGQTLVWSNDGKNFYYVPLTYILPWGWLTETGEDLAKGNLSEASKDVGAMGLPIYTLFSAVKNVDRFGRPIYDPIDAYLATHGQPKYALNVAKDVAGYIWQQTLEPGTITNLRNLEKTKHPIIPRLFGQTVYKYNIDELKRLKLITLRQQLEQVRKEIVRVNGLYRKGGISKADRDKQIQELKKKMKDLVKAYREALK